MPFVISKLLWAVLQPGNLFFAALCLAAALLWTRWRRAGRLLLVALLGAGAAIAVLPFGQWLLAPLENRFAAFAHLPERVDGIIVLGGTVDPVLTRARGGRPAVNGSVERLFAFADMARHWPDARLVYSGGSGYLFEQDFKESEGVRRVLPLLGLDPGRVLFEDRSRNTYENAAFSRAKARPAPGEVWVLITSARHMPRAHGTFQAAGWPTLAYPVDFVTDGRYRLSPRFQFAEGLSGLAAGLKEWLGLLSYYVAGRTDALLPGPGDG